MRTTFSGDLIYGKPNNSNQADEPSALLTDETLAEVIDQLLALGISRDDIVMPGSAMDAVIFIADDFDAPVTDFDDYM